MYRKPIGPTAHGVIDYAFATLNTLRASVGSTEVAGKPLRRSVPLYTFVIHDP